MADKHRWLLSELRSRSLDCFKEGEGVTVVVHADRGAVFNACRFERRWYLGACAALGVTYLLPEDGDVVAACVEWAAGWVEAPPAETPAGSEAPPNVTTRHRLHRLSAAEVRAWMAAVVQSARRRAGGEAP